jgi:ATP-dependent protease ClpP protease subunit
MVRGLLRAGGLLLLTSLATPATAATIELIADDQRIPLISIVGTIKLGDEAKFVELALGLSSAAVILSSDGGNVAAAIHIGQAVRLKGFATAVPDAGLCASACALIWLAGKPRFMGASTQIGFHAAADFSGGTPQEKGAPNAIIGAYLSSLGLGSNAIYYMTSASPQTMEWMSADEARALGIDVILFDERSASATQPQVDEGASETFSSGERSPAVPQFRDYPASAVSVARRAPVDLSSSQARTYRTRLRRAAEQEPNFAGHHVLTTWGCGTTCVTGAAVNLRTGGVVFLPASTCCWGAVDSAFRPVEFRRHSRLVVLAGLLNERGTMGAHFFEFTGERFVFLTTIPTASDFGASTRR